MPAINFKKQIYVLGEHPIFLAYVYHSDDTPVLPSEIQSISVSHFYNGTGLVNGQITTGFFPVEGLQDIQLDISDVFYPTIEIFETVPDPANPPLGTMEVVVSDAFVHSMVPQTDWFAYNFVYIPQRGIDFYNELVTYRTIVKVVLNDGREEIISYDTRTKNYPFHSFMRQVPLGGVARIVGDLYLKDKESNGNVVLPPMQMKDDRIINVWMTVLNYRFGDIVIPRESIGIGTLSATKTIFPGLAFDYNFQYDLETSRLGRPAEYWVVIEIESESGNIPCRFEIALEVT